jgi:hypothetical protein
MVRRRGRADRVNDFARMLCHTSVCVTAYAQTMDPSTQNILRTSPPRPLTDDERLLLHDWIQAAQRFTAFVSERRTDEPAIYRRIVVSLRATRQHLYLIHAPAEPAGWIMLSIATGEYAGRFPTLRAALDYIEPVALPERRPVPPRPDKPPATPRPRPARPTRAARRLGIVGWACAVAIMLMGARWLSRGNGIEDDSRNAEAVAEKLLQDSIGNPDGTQFRNVMAYMTGPANERWVCGWFFTKNAAGESSGPKHVVVHVLLADRDPSSDGQGIRSHLLNSENEVPSISYAWNNYCR